MRINEWEFGQRLRLNTDERDNDYSGYSYKHAPPLNIQEVVMKKAQEKGWVSIPSLLTLFEPLASSKRIHTMCILAAILLGFLCSGNLTAQHRYLSQIEISSQLYEETVNPHSIEPRHIFTCSDDGVVVVSISTWGEDWDGNSTPSLTIVKLDAWGYLVWQRSLTEQYGFYYDQVTGIDIDANDKVSFICKSGSHLNLAEIDSAGEVSITQLVPFSYGDDNKVNRALRAANGDIIVIGKKGISTGHRVAFYRFSSSGALLASALIPPDSTLVYPNAYDAVIEESGTVLVACRINPYTQDLLRLDMDGNVLDRITLPGTIQYPTSQYSIFLSHIAGASYSLVVYTHTTLQPWPDAYDLTFARISDSDAEYWHFSGTDILQPNSLLEDSTGVYLIARNTYIPSNFTTLHRYDFDGEYSFNWIWYNTNLKIRNYDWDDPVHTISFSHNGSIYITGYGNPSNRLAVAKVLPTGLLPVDDEIQIPGPSIITAYPTPIKDELTLTIGKSESSQALTHSHVYNLRA